MYQYSQMSEKTRKFDCDYFKLQNQKRLEHVFIPETPQIRTLIEQFMNRSGCFQEKFYPYKLGWLFHGEPGCGKTSMVKAIANQLNRHVISFNLRQIKSNQELLLLMNRPWIVCQGFDRAYRPEEVIYCLEDLDALSNTLADRQVPTDQSLTQEFWKTMDPKKVKSLISDVSTLDLQGFLNVLDGTIDTPGRVIIMTTNHLSKLDPAIMRPGRVNQVIEFRRITQDCLRQMLEAYFRVSLSSEQIVRLPHERITPAQAEEICIENYQDLEATITAMSTCQVNQAVPHQSFPPLPPLGKRYMASSPHSSNTSHTSHTSSPKDDDHNWTTESET